MKIVSIKNRQKSRRIDVALLKKIVRFLLEKLLDRTAYELGFRLVDAEEMSLVNETFLQHSGSTDVITFDYKESSTDILRGEVFISVDDAIAQAKEFKTTWQSELTRYAVHAVLHLLGYDDLQPTARRKMKHEENRLMKELADAFTLSKLHRAQSK